MYDLHVPHHETKKLFRAHKIFELQLALWATVTVKYLACPGHMTQNLKLFIGMFECSNLSDLTSFICCFLNYVLGPWTNVFNRWNVLHLALLQPFWKHIKLKTSTCKIKKNFVSPFYRHWLVDFVKPASASDFLLLINSFHQVKVSCWCQGLVFAVEIYCFFSLTTSTAESVIQLCGGFW